MSSAQRIRPGNIFQLTRDLASLPETVRLRNIEWGILLAMTGSHTVAQIGEYFELSVEERDRTFSRLIDQGLIAEREVNYTEYLLAASTIPDDEPKTFGRFLRSGAAFGPHPDRPSVPPALPSKPSDPAPARPASPPPSPPAASAGVKASAPSIDPPKLSPLTAPKPPAPPVPPASALRSPAPVVRQPASKIPDRPPEIVDPLAALDEPFDEATTRAIPTSSLAAMVFEPLGSPSAGEDASQPARNPSNPLAGTAAASPPPAQAAIPQSPPMPPMSSSPSASQTPASQSPSVAQSPSVLPQEPHAVNPQHLLSLKAVMRFILDRASDLNAGQLDVYRVFIRVNTKLLKRNGIHTLRFEEDRLISDPELQSAIVAAIQKTLGLRCPQDVFVQA